MVMPNITTTKGIILLLMFFVTFIFSMIPIFFVKSLNQTHDLSRRSKYQFYLSIMSCAAGGVFMGTCILDLFPDVQEQIDILITQYQVGRPFPVAEFIVVFGFLLVLAMEQLVLDYKERTLFSTSKSGTENQTLLSNSEVVRHNLQHQHSLTGITDEPDLTASIRSETGSLSDSVQRYASISNNYQGSGAVDEHCHDHSDLFHHEEIASHSALRSILLLFALSLHSIFEGMAVGLQKTIDNVVALFMVVIFHKGVIALSLSINMVQSKLSARQILLANLSFCLTAPLGVGIGMGIMEMKASVMTALLSGVLQGIACGTFLYVTFFEVLPREMNNGEHRLIKLLFVIIGFSLTCAMLYIDPDSEKYRCYKTGSD